MINLKKGSKIISAILVAVLALLMMSGSTYASPDNPTTNVLVYMIASDLESEEASATEDIAEMLQAAQNFNDNINLIVYAGGTKKWHNDIFSSKENRCVKIDKSGTKLLYSEKTRDMTDPNTLSDFIKYCSKNYPADRNIIVLWDHGCGTKGFGADELHNMEKPMTPMEMSEAFNKGGTYFDIIGFDACMISVLMTVGILHNNCKYMIASEETEPSSGWDYNAWLSTLAKNPKIDTLALGKTVVDTYMDSCMVNAPGTRCTLAVIDSEKFYQNVPKAINGFAKASLGMIRTGEYDIANIQKTLLSGMNRVLRTAMVDAVAIAESVNDESAQNLEKAIRDSVLYNRKYPDALNMNGVLMNVVGIKSMGASAEISMEDMDSLNNIGIDESYMTLLNCLKRYTNSGSESSEEDRTLMDVISGAETYDAAVNSIANKTKLDVTDCYITEDKNHVPTIEMSKEKKELVHTIYRAAYEEVDGKLRSYGGLFFKTSKIPSKKYNLYKNICNNHLYINGKLCPFLMEEETKLDDGRTAIYGYTIMSKNQEKGALHIRLVFDKKYKKATVEPLNFQEIDFSGNKLRLERAEAVSDFDPKDKVSFYYSEYSKKEINLLMTRQNEDKSLKKIIDEVNWKDIKKIEWKNTGKDNKLKVGYAAIDLFFNPQQLTVK